MFLNRVFYFMFIITIINYSSGKLSDSPLGTLQEIPENVTEVGPMATTEDDNEEPENTTKLFRDDFYSRTNVKFPTEDHQSLSSWLKTRQLILLLGGIGTCAVLLIGFAITKMLLGHYDHLEVDNNTHQSQSQLLIESTDQAEEFIEDSSEIQISSDEEEIVATPGRADGGKYQRVN